MAYLGEKYALYTDEEGSPRSQAPSGAVLLKFERSPEGLDEVVRFLEGNGEKPRPNRYGIFGMRIERDEGKCLTQVTFLDDRGHPTADIFGCTGMTSVTDANGRQIELTVLNRNRDWHVRIKSSYDNSHDNPSERKFFDVDGKPKLQGGGYVRQAIVWDNGDRIEVSYFGLHNELISTERFEYDDRGNPLGRTVLDEAGRVLWKD